MVWLVAPSLVARQQGVSGSVVGGDSTKVPGTNPLWWKLICSEFSDLLENPGTPSERAIKHKIDLLPDSVSPAKR